MGGPTPLVARIGSSGRPLWDGPTFVRLEGYAEDVAAEQEHADLVAVDAPPNWPGGAHRGRVSIQPGALGALARRLDDVDCAWLAEGGVGTVHVAASAEAGLAAARRAAEAESGCCAEAGPDLPAGRRRTALARQGGVRPHRQAEPGPPPVPRPRHPESSRRRARGLRVMWALPPRPTYQVTGLEIASPRGRIAVCEVQFGGAAMNAFTEAMDACLVCRGCEVTCPSSVPFGHLMEGARAALAPRRAPGRRMIEWLGYRVVLPHHGLLLALTWVLAFAQRLRLVPRRLGLPHISTRSLTRRRPDPSPTPSSSRDA